MSRNEDKLGAKFSQSGDDKVEEKLIGDETNMFSFPNPTIFIDIPSQGKYYPDGHPLKDKDSVEMYMMNARSEDILTNKSLLKKGLALDRMLHSLLVDKSIDLDTLLIGDKSSLTIETRINGYGSDYRTKFTCPACGETQEHDFDLEEAKKINYGEIGSEFATLTENGFECTLPKSKVKLRCIFLTGKEEKELMYLSEKKKKHNMPETMMTDQMKVFIVSVNGNASKEAIKQFIEVMPAIDSRWLRSVYKKANPNVDLVQEFVCKSCDHTEEVNVPMGVSFLWPSE